jgi:hypothetical protein
MALSVNAQPLMSSASNSRFAAGFAWTIALVTAFVACVLFPIAGVIGMAEVSSTAGYGADQQCIGMGVSVFTKHKVQVFVKACVAGSQGCVAAMHDGVSENFTTSDHRSTSTAIASSCPTVHWIYYPPFQFAPLVYGFFENVNVAKWERNHLNATFACSTAVNGKGVGVIPSYTPWIVLCLVGGAAWSVVLACIISRAIGIKRSRARSVGESQLSSFDLVSFPAREVS